MDAATALNALKTGDLAAFAAAVEWDESEWVSLPAGVLPDGESAPFIGRLGAVTVGITDHGNGRFEARIHSHTDGEPEAIECFAYQRNGIRAAIEGYQTMAASVVRYGQYV